MLLLFLFYKKVDIAKLRKVDSPFQYYLKTSTPESQPTERSKRTKNCGNKKVGSSSGQKKNLLLRPASPAPSNTLLFCHQDRAIEILNEVQKSCGTDMVSNTISWPFITHLGNNLYIIIKTIQIVLTCLHHCPVIPGNATDLPPLLGGVRSQHPRGGAGGAAGTGAGFSGGPQEGQRGAAQGLDLQGAGEVYRGQEELDRDQLDREQVR